MHKKIKKSLICLIALSFMTAILFLTGCQGASADSPDAFIDQMITAYGEKQEAAGTQIEKNLTKLKKQDAELGAVWEDIMDYWSYANTEMEKQINMVPKNLPQDDSLCIVILGKKLNADGSMTDELTGRLALGMEIAEAYPNCYIAVTGGGTADDNPDVTEGQEMGKWLLDKGLDSERLIVEDRAPDTVGNAQNTFAILKEKHPNVKSVVILTSDYHVARGSILFHTTFALDAYKNGTEPIEILAGVGFYTGEASYESFELQAEGVRSVAQNYGFLQEEE